MSEQTAKTPEDGAISLERRGHILMIGLNRPEKYNGLTPKMFSDLRDAFTELDRDEDLRVGVFFAHGKHFTAGLELTKFSDGMKAGDNAGTGDSDERIDPFSLGRRCRKPVVCAVQGITFTAGIEMMLGCDIAIAAEDTRFSQLEPRRGLMAAGGATFRFVERGGWGNAMLHLLTADEFTASEAHRIGLVQEVTETGKQVERALEIAERIAAMAPLAVQATKASALTYALEGERAAIAGLNKHQTRLANTEDFKEGVASFIERRDAKFTGR